MRDWAAARRRRWSASRIAAAIAGTEQTSTERLAKNVEAAHKADCMKDLSGMGLLAAPVILAAEAMGRCAHKL